MTTPLDDRHPVRADPGGLAWTVLLTAALVIVIGLIAYLVFRGGVTPEPVARPAAVVSPKLPAAPVPAPPTPVPAR